MGIFILFFLVLIFNLGDTETQISILNVQNALK